MPIDSTPQERLKSFIQSRFDTMSAFAKALEKDPAYVNHYIKKDGSVFQRPDIQAKLRELGLNYHWYLTGEGEMLIEDLKKNDALDIPIIGGSEADNASHIKNDLLVNSLEGHITSLKKNIDHLEGNIAHLEGEIVFLRNMLDRLIINPTKSNAKPVILSGKTKNIPHVSTIVKEIEHSK